MMANTLQPGTVFRFQESPIFHHQASTYQVSCGAEFTAVIDDKRRLLTFGSPQEGQLGNGTTGEFIEKAGKISFDYVQTPTVVSVFTSKVRRSLRHLASHCSIASCSRRRLWRLNSKRLRLTGWA